MLALRSIARRVLQLTAEERELAREIEAPGWSSSCGASLRVSASQLAQSGALGVDRSFPRGHECLQRLPLTAGPRRRRPLLGKHAAGGAESVKGVGLAARATLPAQPADLEHPPTAAGQEARQACTEGACPFDGEGAPTRGVDLDELQRLCVAVTACGNCRFHGDRAAEHMHDRERVQISVRVDTDDVVQLICEHPYRPPAQALADTSGVGLGWKTAGGKTVTGHAPTGRTGF
jgi:hypothetical protein